LIIEPSLCTKTKVIIVGRQNNDALRPLESNPDERVHRSGARRCWIDCRDSRVEDVINETQQSQVRRQKVGANLEGLPQV
jgi:hypothetical protein